MIIFGGTEGIGNILAEYYKKNGFKVSIVGRYPKSKRLQDGLNVIKADVSRESNVEDAFDLHFKRWGKNPDIVINCAGIQGPIGNSWIIPVKKFEETLEINLLGSFIVSKVAIKKMLTSGYGSIIMFSGGGAAYGRPNFNAYGVSKTGVLRMVETIAEELKIAGYPNIIINAIAPGAVKTGMTADILKAGEKAGKKALEEAAKVFKFGGTPASRIVGLVDFLIDVKLNKGLTGRLIHVREDYRKLVKKHGKKIPDEIGKLRRVPIK